MKKSFLERVGSRIYTLFWWIYWHRCIPKISELKDIWAEDD